MRNEEFLESISEYPVQVKEKALSDLSEETSLAFRDYRSNFQDEEGSMPQKWTKLRLICKNVQIKIRRCPIMEASILQINLLCVPSVQHLDGCVWTIARKVSRLIRRILREMLYS